MTSSGVPRVALVAHDGCKADLVAWTLRRVEVLRGAQLLGTGSTARQVQEATGLVVEQLLGGPYGGDQQLGARIAEGHVDVLVFFWDPLTPQPHDPDVKALLRVAVLQDIAIACNTRTADCVLPTVASVVEDPGPSAPPAAERP